VAGVTEPAALSLSVSCAPDRPIVHEAITLKVVLENGGAVPVRVPVLGRSWNAPIFRVSPVGRRDQEVAVTRDHARMMISGGAAPRPEPDPVPLAPRRPMRAAFDLISMTGYLESGRYTVSVSVPLPSGEVVAAAPFEVEVAPIEAERASISPLGAAPRGNVCHAVWRDPAGRGRLLFRVVSRREALPPEHLTTTDDPVGPDLHVTRRTPLAEESEHRWIVSLDGGALVGLRADKSSIVERVVSPPLGLEDARIVPTPRQGPYAFSFVNSGGIDIPVDSMSARAIVRGRSAGKAVLVPVAIDRGAAKILERIELPDDPETVLCVALEAGDLVVATFKSGERHRFLGWLLPADSDRALSLGEVLPSNHAYAVTAFADPEGTAAVFAALIQDCEPDPTRFIVDATRIEGGAAQRFDAILVEVPEPLREPRLRLDESMTPYVLDRRADGSWVVWIDALPSVHAADPGEIEANLLFTELGTPLLARLTRTRGLVIENVAAVEPVEPKE
jgi:hypothetical protein